MTIGKGDRVPDVNVTAVTADGPQSLSAIDLFSGKTVALFGVPGAFTPTCSAQHLPGFVRNAAALRAKGIHTIACVATNDAFVMGAWGQGQNAGDDVMMLADGSGDWTRAAGLELDLTAAGLGVRCQRFSMIVDDGVIRSIHIDDAGGFEKTSAEQMLSDL